MEATLVDVQTEGSALVLRYEPLRGDRTPIEDRIRLEPGGELAVIQAIGRALRILRAGRVPIPEKPYALAGDPESLASLLRRCEGARVTLHVSKRMERTLTVWTEAGVERIGGVVDFGEDGEGLWIRRRGGQSLLRIPRRSVVRFSSTSHSRPEVVSVEVPVPRELQERG